MANLEIGGATQGFDVDGVNAYINNDIKKNFINAAIEVLRNTSEIEDTVDSVWQGTSADTFKKNLKHDIDIIINAINQAEVTLEGAIRNSESNYKNLDETLVTKRY